MSNNKSLGDRLKSISGFDPSKWLSSGLREENYLDAQRRKQRERREAERGTRPVPTPNANSAAVNDAVAKGGTLRDRVANSAAGRAETEGRPQPRSTSATPNVQQPLTSSQQSDNLDKELSKATVSGSNSEKPGFHELSGSSSQKVDEFERIIDNRRKTREEYEEKMRGHQEDEDNATLPLRKQREMIEQIVMDIGDGSDIDTLKEKMIALSARAMATPQKVREGKGQGSITSTDRDALLNPAARKTLEDGFGDGSWEQMKVFGDSMKILKEAMEDGEWDKVAEKWYGNQSDKIKQVFDGAGDLGSKDGGTNNHFAGFDENGRKIAGKSSNRARTIALVKTFLQQAGLDGYTRHPLRFENMEPDHIRGYQTKLNGQNPTVEDRFNADHPDNWVWTGVGLNKKKSNDTVPDFLKKLDSMKPADQRNLMSDDVLQLQEEGVRHLRGDSTDFAESHIQEYEDEEGKVNIISPTMTMEMIEERQNQQLGLIEELQSRGGQIESSRIMNDMFAAGGSIPKEGRLGLASQNKTDVRERSQARMGDGVIREMFASMVGKEPAEQAKISRGWTKSWKDSLEIIKRNFGLYDAAQKDGLDSVEYDDNDLIFKDNELFAQDKSKIQQIIRGGPTLRKLMRRELSNNLGDSVANVVDKISVNEWLTSELDSRLFL